MATAVAHLKKPTKHSAENLHSSTPPSAPYERKPPPPAPLHLEDENRRFNALVDKGSKKILRRIIQEALAQADNDLTEMVDKLG